MKTRIPMKLQEVAEKMAKVGRTVYKPYRRPRWKEYTLIKYRGERIASKEKIWIDESQYFPSDEDFFWEPETENINKKTA